MNKLLFTITLVALLIAASYATAATAAPAGVPAPQISIKVTDDMLDAPGQIEAGIVAVTFQNNGTQNHNLKFFRLIAGKSVDDLKSAKSFGEGTALLDAAYGGTSSLFPAQSQAVVLDLAEGSYVVASFLRGPPDFQKALLKSLKVVARTSGGTVDEPAADLTVGLTDNSIIIASNIAAGTHTFKVSNDGPGLNQVIILKLAPGKSNDDAVVWLKAEQSGPAPVDNSANNGGTAEFSAGKRGWLSLTMTPGTWFAFNNLPGPNHNVPVFVTVGGPATLPRTGSSGWSDMVTFIAVAGLALLGLGWLLRRRWTRWA